MPSRTPLMGSVNLTTMLFVLLTAVAATFHASGCGGAKPKSCLLPNAADELDRPAWIRPAVPEEKVDPPECAVNADCGERAHAEMTCFHDASCMPICEQHWGDCNHDYRDGCETPIQHPVYCEGDPRIAEEKTPKPLVDFSLQAQSGGPGRFPMSALSRGLGRVRAELLACYERVLVEKPGVEGKLSYQLTIGESGCIAAERSEGEVREPALEACVLRAFANVRFSAGPTGGQVSFPCDVLFLAGTAPSGVP